MSTKPMYVYGPVPSRRLGRSLGVDVIPHKVCSYDCIYCQLGRTVDKTTERKEYVPLVRVLEDIDAKLESDTDIDYITIAGSGEPTLYAPLGELISKIRERTEIPVAVITNGSLLWDRDVRKALLPADLLVPSLDAGDEKSFTYVNRPHQDISFEKMTEGLIALRKQYSRRIWLEVFLMGEKTGSMEEVERIAALTDKIKPDLVQLNTVARPPAEEYAYPVSEKDMRKFAGRFHGKTEVIAEYRGRYTEIRLPSADDVLALLRRRPCTLGDVVKGLGVSYNLALKCIDDLINKGSIESRVEKGSVFYKIK